MVKWLDLDENDERAIAAFMARVATVTAALGELPRAVDPMHVWWKAQLLRRWDAERTVEAPLDVMYPVEIAAGVGVAAWLLYLSLPQLLGF